jgi:hypothetical protein
MSKISQRRTFVERELTECFTLLYKPEVSKLRGAHPGGAVGPVEGDGRVVCISFMFILNEIWAQENKIF